MTHPILQDVIEVHEENNCLEEAEKESNGVDNDNESVLMRIILPQRSSLRISEPSKGMQISSATTLLEMQIIEISIILQ